MSDIGLNTSIYHSTRVYFELLNNFLIDLNYAIEQGKSFSDQKVIDFFNKVKDKTSLDPEIRLIRSYFLHYYQKEQKEIGNELETIINNLEVADSSQELIVKIEKLIDILKDHCFQASSRLKVQDLR